MNLPEFKIRCSAIGQIMTNARGGSSLSATCVNYLEDWAKEQAYGRRKDFYSKQCEKGTLKEDDSIALARALNKWPETVQKNEQYYEDSFFTGTPDVLLKDSVEDIKNAWDAFTFPLFAKEIKGLPKKYKGYEYQLRGYMQLTGRRKAGLIYTLMNAPEHLVDRAAYVKAKDLELDEVPVELFEEMQAFMSYENLPTGLRYKRFEIEADAEILTEMQERVIACRQYIADNIQPLFNHI